MTRKPTSKSAALGENADRSPRDVCSVNERAKFSLELLATDFHLGPDRSFHDLICAEREPLLLSVFLDAPVALADSTFELAHVSRNSRQSQFFASMIRATLETRPIWHCAVESENDADFSTGAVGIKRY